MGRAGELVNVSQGFARNFLFPRKLAVEATEKRMKEWDHLKLVSAAKVKKALAERQEVINKVSGTTVSFKMSAGADSDKLFGSVTTSDISKELEKQGYSVDRRDIHLDDQIKVLGQHKAVIRYGEGLEAQIKINVERA